jgi:hypothetical protein
MATNEKISQLSDYPNTQLSLNDYFPINQYASITTYKTSLQKVRDTLFTGSLYGTSSVAKSAQTASYLTPGTYPISASWSINSVNALTASYAQNVAVNGVSGSGTLNYLTQWVSNSAIGASGIYYTSSNQYVVYNNNLSVLNSYGGQAIFNVVGGYNASVILQSAYSASDAWLFVCGASGAGNSGQYEMASFTGSTNFASKQSNGPDAGLVRTFLIKSNGVYYWPYSGTQTISRDATFNIGVDSGTLNTSSRILIDVFSGSSATNPQTYNLQKAIEVRYGSGSANTSIPTTFCVSSSGKTFIGGPVTVVGNTTLNSPNYISTPSPNYTFNVDAATAAYQFVQLSNNATASITMSAGQHLKLIVHQATVSSYNLFFTGSTFSGSGYYSSPIVWKSGTAPTITTTNGHADVISLYAINTSGLGPKGSGATNNMVIYGTYDQNFY